MVTRQAHERAPDVRVPDRRPLAEQVGQEEEPLRGASTSPAASTSAASAVAVARRPAWSPPTRGRRRPPAWRPAAANCPGMTWSKVTTASPRVARAARSRTMEIQADEPSVAFAADVAGDEAGTQRRAGAVPSPDDDRRARRSGHRRSPRPARRPPATVAEGTTSGKQPGLDAGGGSSISVRPGAGHLVPGVRARRVGRVDAAPAGEAQRQVVLGHQEAGRACPGRGVVVAQPHELGAGSRSGRWDDPAARSRARRRRARPAPAPRRRARVSAQMSAGRTASSAHPRGRRPSSGRTWPRRRPPRASRPSPPAAPGSPCRTPPTSRPGSCSACPRARSRSGTHACGRPAGGQPRRGARPCRRSCPGRGRG